MGLTLTKAADYAVRAMLHIASLPEGTVVLRSQIAEREGIPTSFMAKVLGRLGRAGLLSSCRGVRGGFALARPAFAISMLEIVEAIEGPLALTECSSENPTCPTSPCCPAALVWCEVQRGVQEKLAAVSLEALASARRRGGRVISLGEVPAMPRADSRAAARCDAALECHPTS